MSVLGDGRRPVLNYQYSDFYVYGNLLSIRWPGTALINIQTTVRYCSAFRLLYITKFKDKNDARLVAMFVAKVSSILTARCYKLAHNDRLH